MRAPIAAVGFDLGETLVQYRDTPLDWTAHYRPALERSASSCELALSEPQLDAATEVLTSYNTRVNPRTWEVSADEIFGAILTTWGMHDEPRLEAMIFGFFDYFRQRLVRYEDVHEVIGALAQRGVPIGVLTDVPYGMPSDFIRSDLAQVGLDGRIDVLLTSVDVGRRKPDPHGFRVLAERLNVTPSHMVYVGNEPKDVIGARDAGARAVLIARDGASVDHGQAFTVRNLRELFEHVEIRSGAAAI